MTATGRLQGEQSERGRHLFLRRELRGLSTKRVDLSAKSRNVSSQMKFQSVVMVTGLAAWVWIAAAAPDTSAQSGLKAPGEIAGRADPGFGGRQIPGPRKRHPGNLENRRVRAAGLAGDRGRQGSGAGLPGARIDPQNPAPHHAGHRSRGDVAGRALREGLAERKGDLFDQMHKQPGVAADSQALREPRPIPRLQSRLLRSVDGVAVVAARECLLAGDADGAREFLEMAPADAPGLAGAGGFPPQPGDAGGGVEAGQNPQGRAGGRLAARALPGVGKSRSRPGCRRPLPGKSGISAAMSALLGDPLPWLRHQRDRWRRRDSANPTRNSRSSAGRGRRSAPADLEPLVRSVNSKNRDERGNAPMDSLFLLGEPALGGESLRRELAARRVFLFRVAGADSRSLEGARAWIRKIRTTPAWVEKRFEPPHEKRCRGSRTTSPWTARS